MPCIYEFEGDVPPAPDGSIEHVHASCPYTERTCRTIPLASVNIQDNDRFPGDSKNSLRLAYFTHSQLLALCFPDFPGKQKLKIACPASYCRITRKEEMLAISMPRGRLAFSVAPGEISQMYSDAPELRKDICEWLGARKMLTFVCVVLGNSTNEEGSGARLAHQFSEHVVFSCSRPPPGGRFDSLKRLSALQGKICLNDKGPKEDVKDGQGRRTLRSSQYKELSKVPLGTATGSGTIMSRPNSTAQGRPHDHQVTADETTTGGGTTTSRSGNFARVRGYGRNITNNGTTVGGDTITGRSDNVAWGRGHFDRQVTADGTMAGSDTFMGRSSNIARGRGNDRQEIVDGKVKGGETITSRSGNIAQGLPDVRTLAGTAPKWKQTVPRAHNTTS